MNKPQDKGPRRGVDAVAASRLHDIAQTWQTVPVWKALGREHVYWGSSQASKPPSAEVAVPVDGPSPGGREDRGWATYQWQQPPESRQSSSPRTVDVVTTARRLMAQERSRMRRRTPLDGLGRRRKSAINVR